MRRASRARGAPGSIAAVAFACLLLLSPLPARAEPTLAERYSEASAAYAEGDFAAAAELARTMAEAAAKGSREYAGALEIEALSLQRMGALARAEPLFAEVLAVREGLSGLPPDEVVSAVSNIGFLRQGQGWFSLAEDAFRRSLALAEATMPAGEAKTIEQLALGYNNLGYALRMQGRVAAAEPHYLKALELSRSAAPATQRSLAAVAVAANNLGALYASAQWQGTGQPSRLDDAAGHLLTALMIRSTLLPAGHVDLGITHLNLGAVLMGQGRYDAAASHLKQALAILDAALPKGHPEIAQVLNNLAIGHWRTGNPGEAERMLQLAIDSLVDGHHYRTIYEANLAALYLDNRLWKEAAEVARASAEQTLQRARLAADPRRAMRPVSGIEELTRIGAAFDIFIRAAWEIADERAANADTAFVFAQHANQDAASFAIGEIAVRHAGQDDLFAMLVRDRQDRAWQRQSLIELAYALKLQRNDQRDAEAEARVAAAIAAHESILGPLDDVIAHENPLFAEMSQPQALPIAEVQGLLAEDEALLFAAPVAGDTHLWIVTRTESRWRRLGLGQEELEREVGALRCGLDRAAWAGPQSACPSLVGPGFTVGDAEAGRALPFDAARSHRLFEALFGPDRDLLESRTRLLTVMPGVLAELPPHVLVTAPPGAPGSGARPRWLAEQHAVTVLPSVAALKALRATVRPSGATRAMVGFGNPTLDGQEPKSTADKVRAAAAAYRQSCTLPPGEAEQQLSLAAGFVLGDRAADAGPPDGAAAAVAAWVRRLEPVPATATLLCSLAADPALADSTVFLGRAASKNAVTGLSRAGELARYRFVHFATHGLLASRARGRIEPGLVLTPSAEASGDDDGYLTASEIAGLKLDADAVILSACNTAGAGSDGGDALSGLARSFLYAQARALVVSHWEVDEQAAVSLIAAAVKRAAGSERGLATALAEAMRELMMAPEPARSHPSYWAPFVVVGGGRGNG